MIQPDYTGAWDACFGLTQTGTVDCSKLTWSNGYRTSNGGSSSSTNIARIKATLVTSNFEPGEVFTVSAFDNYFVYVTEYRDDRVRSADFIRHWPKYPTKGAERVPSADVTYTPGHAYVINFLSFTTEAERDSVKNDPTKLAQITCTRFKSSDPTYEVSIGAADRVGLENLVSAKIERSLFPNNGPQFDCFPYERLTFTTKGAEQITGTIGVTVKIRATNSVDPTIKSDWVFLGDYYINDISRRHGSDEITYDCAFAMEIGVGSYFSYGYNFPMTTLEAYEHLAPLMGNNRWIDHLDEQIHTGTRTIISQHPYTIPDYGQSKGGVTKTAMLKMIGAAYAGVFVYEPYIDIMSGLWLSKVKLVRLFGEADDPVVADIGRETSRIESTIYDVSYTGVNVLHDNTVAYRAGNTSDTGTTKAINIPCRFGTAMTATNVLNYVDGKEYKGIIAYNVPGLSPLIYLGDKVKIDGEEVVVNYQVLNLGKKITQTIGAKLHSFSNSEYTNSNKSQYATNESLGNGTSSLDIQELRVRSIIIVDDDGTEHRVYLKLPGNASNVLGT